MRALAIDTSTDQPGVAIWDGSRVAARSPRSAPGHSAAQSQHAERLIGLIDDVLRAAGLCRSDLEVIACCTGPGSFTGVRVGVATAKGIALGLGVPIVGVGSLEAMALAHLADSASSPDEAIVALIDARKGELFWAAYDHEGLLIAGPGHLPVDRAAELGAVVSHDKIVFVGDFAQNLALPRGRVHRAPYSDRPDPGHIARIAAARCVARGGDDLDALEPTYVRPPDITMPRTAVGVAPPSRER